MRIRCRAMLLFSLLVLLLAAGSAFGQADWTADLLFDPYPSPYISDWESNPSIGQAIITNGTSTTERVRVYLAIIHDTRGKLATANSRLFDFPPGSSQTIATSDLIDDKSIDYDHSIRELAVRTGRLPEGKYRVCIRLETESGTVLIDNQCAEFTIVYPDPLYLIYPVDGDSITTTYPMFQWTPVQVPIGFRVHYNFLMTEVFQGQSPAQALAANYPQYKNTNVSGAGLLYPPEALPLQTGKRYAWQVQVLDDIGYPPSANDGKSEIWTFVCAVDTTTPVELRQLAGHIYDASENRPLDSARVVYRAVRRSVSGSDTSWVEQDDSLVTVTGSDGAFKFDSTLDKSYYSISASRREYQPVHLVGQSQYQDGNISNVAVRLEPAPPGNQRLAGVLRDFYSDQPVPNATVTYHVVDGQTVTDSGGTNHIALIENPRKTFTTMTDGDGRFEFLQTADSSFFSLRASNPPGFLDAVDIGPEQRQVGDIDNYILLIKPNAGSITGTLQTFVNGNHQPVSKAIVRLARTTVTQVSYSYIGIPVRTTETTLDTCDVSAYSDASGFFKIQRISQEKPITITERTMYFAFVKFPVRTTVSVESYSYRIFVNDDRFQPYLSTDSFIVRAGETTESGQHDLNYKTGAIVGKISCDSIPVEGARVYLYRAAYHQPSRNQSNASSGSLDMKGGLGPSQTTVEGSETLPANDTTWGDAGSQRPDGDPLDLYQTDATGRYAFMSVPINTPGQQTDQYVLWVETDGYSPAARGDRVEAENEVDTVNLGLSREGGIIYGQLIGSDGAEISNVRVELIQQASSEADTNGSQSTSRWVATGGDGNYSLGNILPGIYHLQYSRTGYNSLLTDTFSVNYGDSFRRDEILNAAKGFIALTVTDKDGKGLSDVCVKSPQIPSLIGFTDSDGKLIIGDAVADSVTLQLRKLSYEDKDIALLVAADDTVKQSVTISKSIGQILVRVVEKGNLEKRLEKMTVQIGKSGNESSILKKTTDVSGEAMFSECPTGQQTITVSPPTDSTYAQDYVIAETQVQVYSGLNAQPLVIEMVPAARMQGSVRDKDGGSSISDVTVSIEGNSKVKATSDATGTFKLRNVPPGSSVTLTALKCGFKSARFKYDKPIAAGDNVTGISIELEKSPMDSLFGFPVALDSVKSGSNGHSRVWGSILNVPPTFGLKLRNEASQLTFADLEVDSAYRPIKDSIPLVQPEVEVNIFGLDGKMACQGGLCLQWIDSVKSGRISGSVTLYDPISKAFSETQFMDVTIPKKYAPSFWAGGVNRGLSKYGLTATDHEVQVQIKAVKIGLDFARSNLDSAGMHLFGSIHFGSTFKVGFEEMLIGRNDAGDIALKSITLKTEPAIKIPFGVFTVLDSSMTWEATGFRASGAIVLNALENREFGFKDLRISPEGEFLSLTVTTDEKNGTINVYGQQFQIESLGFGTENFDSDSLEHVKFFTFAGKLTVKQLDKPVGMSLRYTEKGLFTGKLEFNQSRTFGKIVTISLESIELGYDSTRTDRFVGFSGGVKFGAINGLRLQANNLRFYFSGAVSFDEMAMQFIAGPVEVQVSVAYSNSVFEGKGLFEVRPVFSAGAEFRYGGSNDWWVRIISGTRIPLGACEIVQASGGIGRKDDVWKFSVGGVIAPAKADKGIRLEINVEVDKTPEGIIILGNAMVDVADGTQIGRATLEINIPEKRVNGSIVFGMDYKAITASAQLDLGVKFGEYWYVYGRARIDVLKFFTNEGVIVVANNWQWQHDGKTQLMSGIYIEVNSNFNVNANWYVVRWGVNLDRHAMVYIGWNGDFAGEINMNGGAYAWIGFGAFDLIQARANMGLAAHLSYIDPEWTAGAHGQFSLKGSIGWCGNTGCWNICWKCFIRIFGHCIFALPTGATACIGMNADIEYATSHGMTWSVSF